VVETLKTFIQLYDKTESVAGLIQLCHLDDVKDQLNDRISGGQKQRLLLALALLNQPELVFLDEPSTGLDPHARRHLWHIINTIKSRGCTIVLTTHYMEEAEKLCDDIAIMDKGKIIAHGAPVDLIRAHCKQATVSVPKAHLPDDISGLAGDQNEYRDTVKIRTENINATIDMLLSRRVDMSGVEVRTPTLEDVFLKLTGRSLGA
jgi:ABC-2 type transport system ATP-binding protein